MLKYAIAGLTAMIIVACQPKAMTRAVEKTPVDSVLYFEPRDISDSFFDTLSAKNQNPISLVINRIPPPPPAPQPPAYKEVTGFRVQAFAGVDSLNSRMTAESIREITKDSVYVLVEKGLYKIQIGNYLYRPQADSMRTEMQHNGYSGAWVIKRMIQIPFRADTSFTPFKIQIGATENETTAKEMVQRAGEITRFNSYYEAIGDLFKVFIGSFEKEEQARLELEKIRRAGFPDAWLVY